LAYFFVGSIIIWVRLYCKIVIVSNNYFLSEEIIHKKYNSKKFNQKFQVSYKFSRTITRKHYFYHLTFTFTACTESCSNSKRACSVYRISDIWGPFFYKIVIYSGLRTLFRWEIYSALDSRIAPHSPSPRLVRFLMLLRTLFLLTVFWKMILFSSSISLFCTNLLEWLKLLRWRRERKDRSLQEPIIACQ